MNSDPERLLQQLTPRGAGSEVRSRILAGVGRELQMRSGVCWQRWCGLALAASLVLGIVSNVWVSWRLERRLAKLYGPPVLPLAVVELAKDLEAVSDQQTARWLEQRFAQVHHSYSLPEHAAQIERFLRELETVRKEDHHEKAKENSRDRSLGPGAIPRDWAHWQCPLDRGQWLAA